MQDYDILSLQARNYEHGHGNITLKHGIKIDLLNVCTLLPNVEELCRIIKDINMHILCVNETRLDKSVTDSEVEIDGFNIIRNDRNRRGGGVAIYISNMLSFNIRTDLVDSSKEMIWLEIIPSHSKPFLLACIYRPPSVCKRLCFTDLAANIEKVINLGKNFMIMGDLNIDCYKDEYCHNNDIAKLCQLFHLKQLVSSRTRVTVTSETLIDVILSNFDQQHKETFVLPVTLCDHFMVYAVIGKSSAPESDLNKCHTFKNFNLETFMHENTLAFQSLPLASTDLDAAWRHFKDTFLNISNKYAPFHVYKVKGNA